MGGSISKKNSEPDRLNKALDVLDAPSAPSTAYPPGGRPSHGGDMELSAIPETPVTSIVAQQQQQQPAAGAGPPAAPAADRQEVVPTVFRWEHGGNHVYITGTFNNWSRKVPMHRSGNDFIYIQSLPKGKHAYKFVVDDEWRFAPDQMTVADTAGNINNFLDLANFQPDDDSMPVRSRADSIPGVYGHILPDEDEYSKEPPLLPPHLRQIVLNAASPDAGDPLQLPTPQHVTLNHLYCTAIKDGLMVQAVTQRYRRKHTTTVFYTVMPMSTTLQGAGAVQPMTASGTVPVAQQQQQQGPQQPPNAGGAPMQQQPSQGGGGVNYGAPQPVRPPPHDGGGGANGMPYEYQQQQLLQQQQQQQQMAGRQQQPQQQQQFVQQAQQGSGYAQPQQQQQQQQQQFQPQSPQQQMQQQYSMAQQQQQRIAAQQQQPPGSGPGPGGSSAAGSGSGYSYRPPAYPPAPQAVSSGGSATSGTSSSSVRSGGNVSSHVSDGGGPAPASGSSSSAAHAAAPPVGGRRGSYNGMPDGSRHESQAYSYAAQVAAAYHAQPGSAPYASGY